jgi:hypothetical protein
MAAGRRANTALLRATDNLGMQRTSKPGLMSDQMLLAGYILRALEHKGMPMHAAGYRELAAWAADDLSMLDVETLEGMRHDVPGALQGIVDNLLYERRPASACRIGGPAGLSAESICCALLSRLRSQRPASR